MRKSVIVSRIALFVFCVFGLVINQFSSEQTEKFMLSIPYRCPLRLITGWKCAFCGMTHSWISMFHGDVMKAFHENLFGPVLWLFALFVLIMLAMGKKSSISPRPALPILLGSMVVYAILRNLI